MAVLPGVAQSGVLETAELLARAWAGGSEWRSGQREGADALRSSGPEQ